VRASLGEHGPSGPVARVEAVKFGLVPRLPDDPETGNHPELHRPVVEELLLLRADKVEVDLAQVVK
jgi:hypothetical protein